jgi:hypothetical protein
MASLLANNLQTAASSSSSLGKSETSRNQVLPVRGSRCKTSLMLEALEFPT